MQTCDHPVDPSGVADRTIAGSLVTIPENLDSWNTFSSADDASRRSRGARLIAMDASPTAGRSTDEIMRIGLDLGGMTDVPGDSAIYVPGGALRRVMMGIDIGSAELQLAKSLGVDGVIAHHPAGGAAELGFTRVLSRQIDLLVESGVSMARARDVVQPRIAALLLRAQAANHDHVPSVARLLDLPFLNVHLPVDEAVAS